MTGVLTTEIKDLPRLRQTFLEGNDVSGARVHAGLMNKARAVEAENVVETSDSIQAPSVLCKKKMLHPSSRARVSMGRCLQSSMRAGRTTFLRVRGRFLSGSHSRTTGTE